MKYWAIQRKLFKHDFVERENQYVIDDPILLYFIYYFLMQKGLLDPYNDNIKDIIKEKQSKKEDKKEDIKKEKKENVKDKNKKDVKRKLKVIKINFLKKNQYY